MPAGLPLNAVEAGYSRALVTIIDLNLTTLIAAVLLFYVFGSGPIQGFAVTLTFGLITHVYSHHGDAINGGKLVEVGHVHLK